MKKAESAVGCLLALALVACQPPARIGFACATNTDCDPGEFCLLAAPGGSCTKGCAEVGKTTDCPANTVCSRFGSADQVCANICTADGACRVDYACQGLAGTSTKSCQPKAL
jgi:hypothetical protein